MASSRQGEGESGNLGEHPKREGNWRGRVLVDGDDIALADHATQKVGVLVAADETSPHHLDLKWCTAECFQGLHSEV